MVVPMYYVKMSVNSTRDGLCSVDLGLLFTVSARASQEMTGRYVTRMRSHWFAIDAYFKASFRI